MKYKGVVDVNKKGNKKGFTLVEIIVVLVILAILAAIAVPSVLGYVNEAKDEKYIQEAHSIYTVIQTEEAKAAALKEDADYTAIAAKAEEMTTLKSITITAPHEKNDETGTAEQKYYDIHWTSDKAVHAQLTSNKDVKIVKD